MRTKLSAPQGVWSAPIAAVEFLETALSLSRNHELGVMIAELDFDAPAGLSHRFSEELSSHGLLHIAGLGTGPGRRIARSEPPSVPD